MLYDLIKSTADWKRINPRSYNRAAKLKLIVPYAEVHGWNVPNASKKKAQLLEMAKAGEARPRHKKDPLGICLSQYTNPSSDTYDRNFSEEINRLAPYWFENQAEIARKKLIEMAKAGEMRPHTTKHPLGPFFIDRVCAVNKRSHDGALRATLELLAPHWFEDKVEIRKQELLTLARSEVSRPPSRTKLGTFLCKYTTPSQVGYDADFSKVIRSICPVWFLDGVAQKKAQLLEMAKAGEARPLSRSQLGAALFGYAYPKSRAFDDSFARQIRNTAPDWFERSSEKRKIALLDIASTGGKRPHQKKDPLGVALTAYTCDKGDSYDSEFNSRIRSVRPDWFKRIRRGKLK